MNRRWCHASENDDCKRFAGGDFVGLTRAVILEIHGYSDNAVMRVKLVDLTCTESALTKQVYDEMIEQMTNLFGAASVTLSSTELKN